MEPRQDAAEGEPIRLRPFLGALLADFAVSAKARHVTLDALVFLEEIDGDASLMRRLLARLVGEALRRAPAGTTVSVVVSPREGQAEFRVADEGAGIPVESRDKILEADAAHAKRLSVTETNDSTVVCLAFPCRAQESKDNRSTAALASMRAPASLPQAPASDDTSWLARGSGRKT